jgi:group II intron reverse transcriptase/maturase
VLRATPPAQLFTPEALERAWLAVKRAGGGAGVDGITLELFDRRRAAELAELRAALVGGAYRPHPVRQVMVPKRREGLRPLAIWALRDRVAQRVIYDLLAPVFEGQFLPCSYGFRVGRSIQDAVAELIVLRERNLRWVLDADIQDCFDTIPPARLLGLVRRRVHDALVLRYVAGWLYAQVLNSADGVPRAAGASQGNVLSPLLANIYLHEVDRIVVRQRLAYLRYADDFVVCSRTQSEAEAAEATCRHALAAWGLALNPRKTHVVHFDEGFTWLGHFFVRRECYPLERG